MPQGGACREASPGAVKASVGQGRLRLNARQLWVRVLAWLDPARSSIHTTKEPHDDCQRQVTRRRRTSPFPKSSAICPRIARQSVPC